MALTPKQERFVAEYLIDLNATQAAIRAGYSARTANEQGARLLAKASIKTAIQVLQAERANRVELTAEWVLTRLMNEARREGEGSSPAARVKALELLGKRLALWLERVRVEGGLSVEVVEKVVDANPPEGNQTPPDPGSIPPV